MAGRDAPRRRASDVLICDGEPEPKRPTLEAGEVGLSPPASPSLPTCPPPPLPSLLPGSLPLISPTHSPLPLSRRRFYESMMGDEEPPAPPALPEPLTDSVSLSSDGDSGIVREEATRQGGDGDELGDGEAREGGSGGEARDAVGKREISESERGSESEAGKRATNESERDLSDGEEDSGGKGDTSESERDLSEGDGGLDEPRTYRRTAGEGEVVVCEEGASITHLHTGDEEGDPGGGGERGGATGEEGDILRVSQGQSAGNEVSAREDILGGDPKAATTPPVTTTTAPPTPATPTGGIDTEIRAPQEPLGTVIVVSMTPGTPPAVPPPPPPPHSPVTLTSDLPHPNIGSKPLLTQMVEEHVDEERVTYAGTDKHEDVTSSEITAESEGGGPMHKDRLFMSVTLERSEPEPQGEESITPEEPPVVGAEGVETGGSDKDSERDSLIVSHSDSDQDLVAEEEEDIPPLEDDLGTIDHQPWQDEEEEKDLPQVNAVPENGARGTFDKRVCADNLEEEESVEVTLSSAGPRILITVAGGDREGATAAPSHFQESASATSGWGVSSLEGVVFTSTHHDSSLSFAPPNSVAAHLIHPRAPTPKSPITVDEWVAALPPHPTSVEEEGDAWPGGDDDPGEDSLNLGAEAGLMCGSVGVSASSSAPPSTTHTLHTTAAATTTEARRSSQPESTLSAAAATKTLPIRHRSLSLLHPRGSDASAAVSTRPLTLTDVANIQQMERMGVESRRSQFASLKDKQSSFQSELSGLSLHSRSSIDSLLDSRQADPVEVLLSLGFGGQPQDGLTRIPERFLKPSKVPGNKIEDFLKSEEELTEMMETAEMMPGIDPQGLAIMRGGLSPRGRRYYRHRRRYLRALSPHTSIYSAPPSLHHWHRNRFLSVQRE